MEQAVSTQEATSGKRFFRVQRRKANILMALSLVAGLLIIVGEVLQWAGGSRFTFLDVSNVLTALLVTLVAWLARRSSLRFSSEGVECTIDIYRYRTSWDNIQHITTKRSWVWWKKNLDCFILHEPGTNVGGWLTLPAPKSVRRVIPLVSSNWRGGEIAREIRKYAPHLLP